MELSGGTIEKLAFNHQRDSTRAREAFFLEFSDKVSNLKVDVTKFGCVIIENLISNLVFEKSQINCLIRSRYIQ